MAAAKKTGLSKQQLDQVINFLNIKMADEIQQLSGKSVLSLVKAYEKENEARIPTFQAKVDVINALIEDLGKDVDAANDEIGAERESYSKIYSKPGRIGVSMSSRCIDRSLLGGEKNSGSCSFYVTEEQARKATQTIKEEIKGIEKRYAVIKMEVALQEDYQSVIDILGKNSITLW